MIQRSAARLLLLLLSGSVALPLYSAESTARATSPAPPAALEAAGLVSGLDRTTNLFHPLAPGPGDGSIAFATALMLQKYHYSRQPFDAAVSSKFLDRYLEALDPQHMHFTQSDLAQFERFRTNLDRLTLPARSAADTRPAYEIFNRFVERLQQRVAYADELLKNEKFTFDADERIVLNRKELPFPKDLDEAKALWRERLRFEYLQEELGKLDARKKKLAKAEPEHPANSAGAPNRRSDAGATPVPDPDTYNRLRQALRSRLDELAAKPNATSGSSPGHAAPATTAQAASAGPEASAPQTAAKPAAATPKKSEREDIVETLGHRYHRNLHTFLDWDNDDVLPIYLTALAHVYDPHSDYFGHSQLDSFAIGMSLSLFGIGAELISEDGYCKINRLLPGGPAAKSKKMSEKDRIIAVAQSNQPPVDVVDMSLNRAVQLIRGPKGTEVRLTIIPAGEDSSARTVVSLIRDEIKLEDQEAKAKIIELPADHGEIVRLGVIDLPSFYASFDPANTRGKTEPKSTTADVATLLAKLKQENVGGVILDLRRNGGGSLEEAIRLTGIFIKEGPVVQVRNWDGDIEVDKDNDPSVVYEGPLIVLTSRFSASASEILAGALQDYGRALIVGDSSTHGKGTVQSVNPLKNFVRMGSNGLTNDPGALKLTIKKFYRASGGSTQLKGVVPDIVLPSVLNEMKDIGEAALENPLPWDTIPSAKLDHLNMVAPYLPELLKRSEQRLSADKEFAYIREDIGLFKKQQADKTVSLNEKQRLKEKAEADARQKARDKERLARKDPAEKVYELTLKLATMPGLPPAVGKTNSTLVKLDNLKGPALSADSTNSPLVAAATDAGAGPLDDPAEEEKPPAVDATLTEAEHVLVDYLSVLPKNNIATAGRVP